MPEFGVARREEIPILKKLYEEAFGSAVEAQLVFEALEPELCHIAREDGVPAAMAFVLPVDIRCAGSAMSAAYVFAVATFAAARGRGLSTALLEHIRVESASRGVRALLLRPASEPLAEFYAARGYRYVSRLGRVDASFAVPAGDTELTELSPAEYAALRRELLIGSDHLAWDEAMLELQYRFLRLYGGGYCAIGDEHRRWGCAAYYQLDGLLDVQELLTPPERVAQSVGAFLEKFGPSKLTARLEARRASCLGVAGGDFLMAACTDADFARINGFYAALVMD